MRKFFIFKKVDKFHTNFVELPPITYDEFVLYNKFVGSSDVAYDVWLNENDYVSLDSLDKEEVEKGMIFFDLYSTPSMNFTVNGKNIKHDRCVIYCANCNKISHWNEIKIIRCKCGNLLSVASFPRIILDETMEEIEKNPASIKKILEKNRFPFNLHRD